MEHPQLRGFSEWRLLARGKFAVVWEARQLSLDRLVAVKVYPTESEKGDRRFLREVAAGGLSNHPGIVTAHDAGILPDDRPYLIMELCPGGALTGWLQPEHRPREDQVRQVGVRIAAALAAVHARGLLHRDIRPANILIDSYGHAGLANFGLAARANEVDSAADAPPASAYAPPETFRQQPVTGAGDVYSLATTLYALLAGGPPRRGGATLVPIEQTVADGRVTTGPLTGVSSSLANVLLIALSRDPAARPTAARFHDQLVHLPPPAPATPAVETEPPREAEPVVSPGAPRRRGRRREAVLALAVVLVAGVAAVTAWLASGPVSSGVSAATAQSATPGGASASAAPSRTSDPGSARTPAAGDAGSGAAAEDAIQLQDPVGSARPFRTVQIRGTYHGGAETFLRVQRWDEGSWLAFPIPTKTDRSGQFTAYVELGQPGRYRVRVLDPTSGLTSKPTVLVIKG